MTWLERVSVGSWRYAMCCVLGMLLVVSAMLVTKPHRPNRKYHVEPCYLQPERLSCQK